MALTPESYCFIRKNCSRCSTKSLTATTFAHVFYFVMGDDLDDVDVLFRLPLAEFTGARNSLAAKLKKGGRGADAVLVKALVKPPVSAWAVNQLYWNHREAFDGLIASGERFHKAQRAGKIADMRTALDARSKALTHLSNLATSLLRDAEHNPSLDTMRRVTTTLEALSVYASGSDAPRPGRLTHDVDPPGFESLASFVPNIRSGSSAVASRTELAPGKTRGKAVHDDHVSSVEETRKVKIAAAKVSLHDAKRALARARVRAQGLEMAQKKAEAEAKKTERHSRAAEERLEKAKAASEDAARHARSIALELEDATKAMDAAERTVEEVSKELETLSRESLRT